MLSPGRIAIKAGFCDGQKPVKNKGVDRLLAGGAFRRLLIVAELLSSGAHYGEIGAKYLKQFGVELAP
ncbi:MAG: hypothetical protein ACI8Z1_000736 [Candidatus Azotimanducaceae bacterium]|jgi:hypothetical protein